MSYPEDFVMWACEHSRSVWLQPVTKTTFMLTTHRGYPAISIDELFWYYLFLDYSNT